MRSPFVFGVLLASCSTVACTAYVLGKLDGAQGFPTDGAAGVTSSSSGTNSAALDRCSLLQPQNPNYEDPAPPNVCASCIQDRCRDDVGYACGATDEDRQDWFNSLRGCAQRPWNGFADPDASTSDSWGCGNYAGELNVVNDESPDGKKYQSEECVQTNCINTKEHPCRLCEVWMQTPTGQIRKLSQDPCGECFSECKEDIVDCCNSQPLKDFVLACAFVGSPGTELEFAL